MRTDKMRQLEDESGKIKCLVLVDEYLKWTKFGLFYSFDVPLRCSPL